MRSSIPLSRKRLLILLGISTVAFNLVLAFLDRKLIDAGGPSIVEFELAGSEQRAAAMIAEWGSSGRDYARWSLWIDYGFMLSYGCFFALAATATRDFASNHDLRRLAAVGVLAPFLALGAAGFDAVENAFLLLALGGHGGSFAPPIATLCASVKFVLIACAIAYVLWGLVARLLRGRRAGQAPQA